MRTVTIDILNEKAMILLRDLELLQLLRLRKDKIDKNQNVDWNKYQGAMTKQPLDEVNDQLAKRRDEWE